MKSVNRKINIYSQIKIIKSIKPIVLIDLFSKITQNKIGEEIRFWVLGKIRNIKGKNENKYNN